MDPQEVVQMTFDDFNNRTYRQNSARYIASDAVLVDGPTGQESYGPEGNIMYADMWITAFPDAMIEVKSHQVNGNRVVSRFIGKGTFTGQMPAPDGSMIQGSGQRLEMEFTQDAEVADGMITRATTTYDMGEFMRQLGLA